MCDTLAFLRLSLVEGFHITFAQRIWIIRWKFYYVLIAVDELLRKSTGYKFLLWNLPPDWKQACIFLMCGLYHCNLSSKMISDYGAHYTSRGKKAMGGLFPPCPFPALPWLWLRCAVTKGTRTKETQLPLFLGLLRIGRMTQRTNWECTGPFRMAEWPDEQIITTITSKCTANSEDSAENNCIVACTFCILGYLTACPLWA